MASGTHVSKRKSSSSSSHHKKKKLSKKSSEGKKRKVSRSRKRDKSRKLLPVRDVSVSVSVSVSSSDESVSSSDSEDGHKRRKGRSRAREDAKGKKRVKRSSSSESPVRKKRRDSSKLKKKLHKKSSKRDVSVDDSRGLSISSASGDSKGLRVRNKVKEEVKTSLDKSGNEDRYKYRSRSCSSCSEASYEGLVSGSYAGRLRSVLTFPDKVEVEGRYQSKDENKVEIIHAYDDPPPCKSNDSHEVGRKRESSHQASTLPEKKRVVCDGMVEDGRRKESSRELNAPPEKETQTLNGNEENATLKTKRVGIVEVERRKEFSHQVKIVPEKKTNTCENVEDAFTSKSRMTQSTKGIMGDAVAAYGGIDHTANMESTKTANKSEVSSGIVSSELSDLESILRQKALENFRKFRGGGQPNTTPSDQRSGNGVNKTIKTESSKEVGSSIVIANDTKASEMKHSSTEVMKGIAVTKSPIRGVQVPDCDSKRLESHDTMRATHPSVRRIPDGNSRRLGTCDTGNAAANPSQGSEKFVSNRLVDTKTMEKRIINLGGIRKFNHGSLVYRRQASQDYSDGKAQETRSMLNRVVSEPPKAAADSSNPCESSTCDPTLCSTPAAGEQVTTESGNAAKGGSEAKCPETKNTLNKNIPSPPKAAVGSSDPPKSNKSPGSAASEAATSLPTPETGKHVPTESGNAGNGGSEFKQKTMSVMRGGEMVQVSYKVYIPQKPPALARRQLKR